MAIVTDHGKAGNALTVPSKSNNKTIFLGVGGGGGGGSSLARDPRARSTQLHNVSGNFGF